MAERVEVPPAQSALSSNKVRILVVAVVLALALGYMIYAAFPGNTRYYLTVAELLNNPASADGKPVRVFGKLQPDSFQRQPDSTTATFSLTDGDKVLQARYEGVVPDLFFNPHSDIVLEGKYGSGQVFQAESIIVKCPSKFQEQAKEPQG